MAPEVITPNATYDQGADWWSLGCVIYQFLTGHSPFRGSGGKKLSKEEVDRRTLEADVKYPDYISADAKDLIKQLLDRDPKNRLGLLGAGCDDWGGRSFPALNFYNTHTGCRGKGASEIRSHPWFADIDWQALVDHKLTPKIRPFQGQVSLRRRGLKWVWVGYSPPSPLPFQ